ncbi:hypothetical protein KR093_007475 [Drosophila rubida]|uniref:Proteasome subunit alpha type-2 n=1 Tax=Drosophila rubida TaxID=30044 RepID=A0AAD4KAX6_9MUSC|nr:hypothetical protein KR093_007475 [Drosophila rubida]
MCDKMLKLYSTTSFNRHRRNYENRTAVALSGTGCSVIATQKFRTVPNPPASIYELYGGFAGVVTGAFEDCMHVMNSSTTAVTQFLNRRVSVDEVLWPREVDSQQLHTLTLQARSLDCNMLFISYDEEYGPHVYRTELEPQYYDYFNCAAGSKMTDAHNYFRKHYKYNMPDEEALQMAVNCLASATQVDFKASDIEVGIVSESLPRLHKLSEGEIKHFVDNMEIDEC